jgi:DNA-binding transcriptional LysR family regulator
MNPRDIRSLDIGMLRTFEALMRERSVSRAAAHLFLSQPAVSASLNRLREVFDDPLFTRTSHGVTPTPRALALAPKVLQVLGDIGALLDVEQPFNAALSDRVFRIAGSDHASRRILPELSQRLIDLGSMIRIVWEPPSTWPLAQRLHQGDLDLAVVARIRQPQDMETLTLYEDHYVYVMRHDHPRAGEPVSLDMFCEIPQIFLGYGTSMLDDLIDETLARGGRQRLAQIAVTSFGQIVHQLQHSDHAAVLGRRVADAHAQGLRIAPLPFEFPGYRALLCWHGRAERDPGIGWLKAQIQEIYDGCEAGRR